MTTLWIILAIGTDLTIVYMLAREWKFYKKIIKNTKALLTSYVSYARICSLIVAVHLYMLFPP